MLLKILGWFWIVSGVLFVLKPSLLRSRLQRKSYRTFRKYFFLLAVSLGIVFAKVAWTLDDFRLRTALIVVGIIAIARGFFFLKAKAAEKVISWFTRQSLAVFRIGALVQILIGSGILWLVHKEFL